MNRSSRLGSEVHLGEITIRWRRDPKIKEKNSLSQVGYVGTADQFPGVYVRIDTLKSEAWTPGDEDWFIYGRICLVDYSKTSITVHFAHPNSSARAIKVEDVHPATD